MTKHDIATTLSNYLETGIDVNDLSVVPDPVHAGVYAVRLDTGAPGHAEYERASDAYDGPRYLTFLVDGTGIDNVQDAEFGPDVRF